MNRTIVIGDIHGYYSVFENLLTVIKLTESDTLITLGDYVDRGPDSKSVIEKLLSLECKLIPILGNHDEAMLHAKNGKDDYKFWLKIGGNKTVSSYNHDIKNVPYEHWQFLKNCLPFYETETHIFVHANYLPQRKMQDCSGEVLRWNSFTAPDSSPHFSGKTVIMGHTVQPGCKILDLGYAKVIDTGVYWKDGCLTALDINSEQIWQANNSGEIL